MSGDGDDEEMMKRMFAEEHLVDFLSRQDCSQRKNGAASSCVECAR